MSVLEATNTRRHHPPHAMDSATDEEFDGAIVGSSLGSPFALGSNILSNVGKLMEVILEPYLFIGSTNEMRLQRNWIGAHEPQQDAIIV